MKRALEARAPKLIENTKSALFIRGGHTSTIVTQALKDVVSDTVRGVASLALQSRTFISQFPNSPVKLYGHPHVLVMLREGGKEGGRERGREGVLKGKKERWVTVQRTVTTVEGEVEGEGRLDKK